MNLVKIASACAVECERQQVGLMQVASLINTYQSVVWGDIDFVSLRGFTDAGNLVEPFMNRFGFRTTPVTFQDGGSSASPSEIARLMDNLVENINVFLAYPPAEDKPHALAVSRTEMIDALVKEFLWIHPFRDGNGRVGFLLQNSLDGTLDDPQPLRNHF